MSFESKTDVKMVKIPLVKAIFKQDDNKSFQVTINNNCYQGDIKNETNKKLVKSIMDGLIDLSNCEIIIEPEIRYQDLKIAESDKLQRKGKLVVKYENASYAIDIKCTNE